MEKLCTVQEMDEVLLECREKSLDMLRSLVTESGFAASLENTNNYYRVWGRDGIITGLAALATEDEELLEAFTKTLQTLRQFQDETGRIPSNVSVDQKNVSYGTTVGRIDTTIWYIIGYTELILHGKAELDKEGEKSLRKAIFYLSCLELNGKGLLYIPEGGDWADEFVHHGYILFDQILYYIALRNAARILKDKTIKKKVNTLEKLIEVNYFPQKDLQEKYIFNRTLYDKYVRSYVYPIPVSFFNSYTFSFRIDTFASSLLILLEFLSEEHQKDLKKAIREIAGPNSISPAFHPVIQEDDPEWNILRNNHLFEFRNRPYEYHNGGLWPLVHGFYISGIRDKKLLEKFARVLREDGYIFPEFYHGKTGARSGVRHSAFTASSYLIAYESVMRNAIIFTP